jgi:hypothetical protein
MLIYEIHFVKDDDEQYLKFGIENSYDYSRALDHILGVHGKLIRIQLINELDSAYVDNKYISFFRGS